MKQQKWNIGLRSLYWKKTWLDLRLYCPRVTTRPTVAPASSNCNDVVLSLVDFTGNLELVFIGINSTKRFGPAGLKCVRSGSMNEASKEK